MNKVQVAILGGGAAGLSAAMFMQGYRSKKTGKTYQCDVYEVNKRLGGNVASAYGEDLCAKPFGDLGVNDFNHSTYTFFVSILALLKEQGYDVPYTELTDSTLFFSPEKDGLKYTYTQLELSDDQILQNIWSDWVRFRDHIKDALKDPGVRAMTVDEYCEKMNFTTDFINYNLKPRINGMYYTNGADPGSMSIYGVMVYYALQENIANPNERGARKYFKEGASSWIYALEKWGRDHGAEIHTGQEAKVYKKDGKWVVNGKHYDKIVSALPANALANTFQQYLPKEIVEISSGFEYLESTTWWHRDPSVLPEPSYKWQTYNITIQPPGQKTDRPYTISYVSNLHQGGQDQEPPFITVNPPKSLDNVLQMVDPADSRKMIPAKLDLWHNTLYPRNIQDQANLRCQQGNHDLWFTGGWTVGAGLHEEILGQSLVVSLQVMGILPDEYHAVHDPDDPSYVPAHIRAYTDGESFSIEDVLPEDHPLFGG